MDKHWQTKYDNLANQDIPDWQRSWWWHEFIVESQRRLIDKYLPYQGIGKNVIAVDAGCGPGIYVQQLHKMGYQVTGIDFSINMLQLAKKRCGNSRWGLIKGETESLPLKENIADAVLFFGLLQTSEYPLRQIEQISRILKPGGVLLMSALRQHNLWELPFWPIYLLLIQGYLPSKTNRITNGVKIRDYFIPRPVDNENDFSQRYTNIQIKSWLTQFGFHKITFRYDGLLNNIPRLYNSTMIYGKAIKK